MTVKRNGKYLVRAAAATEVGYLAKPSRRSARPTPMKTDSAADPQGRIHRARTHTDLCRKGRGVVFAHGQLPPGNRSQPIASSLTTGCCQNSEPNALDRIDVQACEKFRAELFRKTGHCNTNAIIAVLGRVLEMARRHKQIRDNPTDDLPPVAAKAEEILDG